MNETIQTFGYPATLIKDFDHWVILLRPKQITIGTLVLAAKSESMHLGQLGKDAWTEFSEVSSYAETLLKEVFGAEKFNYLALMMKDPNVHFHLVPRYSNPVNVADYKFIDPDWPLKTEFKAIELSADQLNEIKLRLLRHE